jgi:hypothetical protein
VLSPIVLVSTESRKGSIETKSVIVFDFQSNQFSNSASRLDYHVHLTSKSSLRTTIQSYALFLLLGIHPAYPAIQHVRLVLPDLHFSPRITA